MCIKNIKKYLHYNFFLPQYFYKKQAVITTIRDLTRGSDDGISKLESL